MNAKNKEEKKKTVEDGQWVANGRIIHGNNIQLFKLLAL
jgi:hypothetical protein